MIEYGYEPGQVHPELDVINPEPIPLSRRARRARSTPPPPPPPPPSVSVRPLLEPAPDTSWIRMEELGRAGRGRLVPPSARGRAPKAWHECDLPPIQPEGTTWDCPECWRVWIVELYHIGGTTFRPLSWVWGRASWRTARAHRRAL